MNPFVSGLAETMNNRNTPFRGILMSREPSRIHLLSALIVGLSNARRGPPAIAPPRDARSEGGRDVLHPRAPCSSTDDGRVSPSLSSLSVYPGADPARDSLSALERYLLGCASGSTQALPDHAREDFPTAIGQSKESLAPSQSLSQVALHRRAQGTGRSHVGENAEEAGKPSSIRDPQADDTQAGKTMALLDWARRVGREHDHASYGPASAGIGDGDGAVVGTPLDGTDVDPGSGTSSSEVEVVRDHAGRQSVDGEGSFDDDPRAPQEEGREDTAWRHDPHEQYFHPGPGAFPHPPHPPENASSRISAGWQSPRLSDRVPGDDEVSALERMTIGGTTTVGGMTVAGGVPL